MTVKTWDTSRVGGGTYELERDATTGSYSLKSVGFAQANKLNLPDLISQDKETPPTGSVPKQPKVDDPYKKLFKKTQDMGDDIEQDYSGVMLKTPEVKDVSVKDAGKPMAKERLTESFAGEEGPVDTYADQYKKSLTESFAGEEKPTQTYAEQHKQIQRSQMTDANVGHGAFDATKPYPDAITRGQVGVKGVETTTGLQKIKSGVKKVTQKANALQAVKSTSKTLSKAFNFTFKTPMMMLLGAISGPPTATQTHAKGYFNVRGGNVDGQRIAGNPAKDLYAGMNRVSQYGNLERAGAKRIATREKTIAKNEGKWSKEKMDRFKATTNSFKDQEDSYTRDKHNAVAKDAVKKGADPMNPSEMRAASIKASNERGNSDNGGNGGGRVICTELHRTGEMSTRDWLRDIKFTYKDLSKEHIKGYLLWAIPTVEHIKKYPTYRKIWKHLAQHRANDIAWRLNQGKFDLLGRIYAGIGEPLCWLIGKCVSDKQLKELKLNSWRRA
jgi:hypothetical protein